jgi:hypothetical protein
VICDQVPPRQGRAMCSVHASWLWPAWVHSSSPGTGLAPGEITEKPSVVE